MHEGDVLFGKRRAYQKKVAIAPFDGIFSAHGMVLRPHEDVIDKDFFPLFISSDYFLDAAIKISVGSLSPTINWRDLKELEFELPEIEEQRRLAKVLWAINDTMESYKKLIAATDELVKSQFMEQFGDLVIISVQYPHSETHNIYDFLLVWNEGNENRWERMFCTSDDAFAHLADYAGELVEAIESSEFEPKIAPEHRDLIANFLREDI